MKRTFCLLLLIISARLENSSLLIFYCFFAFPCFCNQVEFTHKLKSERTKKAKAAEENKTQEEKNKGGILSRKEGREQTNINKHLLLKAQIGNFQERQYLGGVTVITPSTSANQKKKNGAKKRIASYGSIASVGSSLTKLSMLLLRATA